MIQKIKKEIEDFLELNDHTLLNRNDLIYNISKLLQNQINQSNIYNFSINCGESNNSINYINDGTIKIDIYIQPKKCASIINLDIIYNGDKIRKLRKLRKKKLEQLHGTS